MKIYGYGRQSINQEDVDAVLEVLRSDFLTRGPKVHEFENAICEYTGARYCVVVSNGTMALHLSMVALEIGQNDEVITTPNTFAASANCISYVGGTVRFADVDSETANMDVGEVKKRVSVKTKAIVPVHFAGQSCDMESLREIALQRGLFIVEDASHAIGSDYRGTKIGSCKYSDMTVFSFHAVKTITTGEGGAITTNNERLYEKLLLLRSHGIAKSPDMDVKYGRWYCEMRELGFNYRMTDLQAALGISQLKRLEEFKKKRHRIVSMYHDLFSRDSRVAFLKEKDFSCACFHLCPALINFKELAIDKRKFVDHLFDAGLRLQVHYMPVHLHPYYRSLGFKEGDYPNAEIYYSQTISLPLYCDLSDNDIHYIVNTFLTALN
ncbi:MAG: UDP-4-amino-4,6-dideoxy-N-acetyl-beta-L-altrosamine transaminase [Holosporaceae bacterium]|jgi:UDP-4-amino-4,6-dideoxy-N-acetyl-beta-L-altrosamine transaminase|nr:UDP-4-amino-4,6-dideoxy-N-acetyl-beta-L-altrosamine transaminase [Holosporaceae bacterium]